MQSTGCSSRRGGRPKSDAHLCRRRSCRLPPPPLLPPNSLLSWPHLASQINELEAILGQFEGQNELLHAKLCVGQCWGCALPGLVHPPPPPSQPSLGSTLHLPLNRPCLSPVPTTRNEYIEEMIKLEGVKDCMTAVGVPIEMAEELLR